MQLWGWQKCPPGECVDGRRGAARLSRLVMATHFPKARVSAKRCTRPDLTVGLLTMAPGADEAGAQSPAGGGRHSSVVTKALTTSTLGLEPVFRT